MTPDDRPRVGFVLHVMQVAGAEVLVREIIRRLAGRITPTVFCLDSVGAIGEELIADGVEVLALGRKPGWDFRIAGRLAKEAAARRIDILHAHQYTPFFYAALAKPLIRHRPRLILTEHGRHYPDLVSPVRRAVNRLVLDRLADEVTACVGFSGRALRNVDGFRGNRIRIIDNGIDVERYGPPADKAEQKRALGFDPARRYVVHVARHHPVKDQTTLLKGFAAAAPHLKDVDLLMAGDGPLREQLEALAGSLGITDRVKFLGIRKDVPEVLRAGDVFTLTSVSEASSLTLLEAMATGLPSVVSDVGGNPDLIRRNVDGLLFPRGDAAACGAAFRQLLGEPGLAEKLGANARKRANDRFRLDDTVERYARLYGL
ncbi:MAG: glycosyltransferase [Fimbriiglobus sp.]|jgi:glycosyltransferase involved in cell wall biosynthesis|nr:glycosyltransferase [Fimbriiglobus sp.]